MGRKKKLPDYMKPSAVVTRKLTQEERVEADKSALQGLKNVYSKYALNCYYGKEDMPEIKKRIEEIEREGEN